MDSFDPYHKWLGIRDPQRPPNHYRLLGLELFVDDPEVIEEAAHRQMAHVRTHQLGPHADVSQRLLNELAGAKICLLDRVMKGTYDASLQRELFAGTSANTIMLRPRTVIRWVRFVLHPTGPTA